MRAQPTLSSLKPLEPNYQFLVLSLHFQPIPLFLGFDHHHHHLLHRYSHPKTLIAELEWVSASLSDPSSAPFPLAAFSFSLSLSPHYSPLPLPLTFSSSSALFQRHLNPSSLFNSQWSSRGFATTGLVLGSLTDTRYPKRRPGFKSRRKRASLRPKGPYAWVEHVPGEPIPESRPNVASRKGSKRKKRIAQRKAFILSEKKKRKAQFAEFRKKRDMERIERKMAAVAREKAWAERLIELQKIEADKKAAVA